jgi:hypothetical protein
MCLKVNYSSIKKVLKKTQVLKVIGKGRVVASLTTCNADSKPNSISERFISYYEDKYIRVAEMHAEIMKISKIKERR